MQPGPENLPAGSARDVGESGPVGSATIHAAEQALDALLQESHLAGGHDIPNLVAAHVPGPAHDAVIYLTDLQQRTLIPFLPARPSQSEHHVPLGVDSTVAGRAFQLVHLQTQEIGLDLDPAGRTRV
jgi:hypothetical protein